MKTRWISIFVAAAFGAFAGSILAGLLIFKSSDPVAVLSSLATLAAAVAAFLTVREMQAARKLSARARLGFGGAQNPVSFTWSPTATPVLRIEGPATMILRNTTAGSADTVRAKWRATNKITEADLRAINTAVNSFGVTVTVQPSSYEIRIVSRLDTVSIPIAGLDEMMLGDLGPAQELELPIPVVVTNYAILKWLSLMASNTGSAINPLDVPRFDLVISHGNAYENSIEDAHEIRFPLVSVKSGKGSERAISVQLLNLSSDRDIEGSILPEIWSNTLQNGSVISV